LLGRFLLVVSLAFAGDIDMEKAITTNSVLTTSNDRIKECRILRCGPVWKRWKR